MDNEMMPILLLDLVGFAEYGATEREMVLETLQKILDETARFIAPHSEVWKKWRRRPTGSGYELYLEHISAYVALVLAHRLVEALNTYNRSNPELPIRLRLVLGFGSVRLVGDSYFGEVLNHLKVLSESPALAEAEQRLWHDGRTGAVAATAIFSMKSRESRPSDPPLEDLEWLELEVNSSLPNPPKAKILKNLPTQLNAAATPPQPKQGNGNVKTGAVSNSIINTGSVYGSITINAQTNQQVQAATIAPNRPTPEPKPEPRSPQQPDTGSAAERPESLPQAPQQGHDQKERAGSAEASVNNQAQAEVSRLWLALTAFGSGTMVFIAFLGGIFNASNLTMEWVVGITALCVVLGLISSHTPLRGLIPANKQPYIWPPLLGIIVSTWLVWTLGVAFDSSLGHEPFEVSITVVDSKDRPVLDADVRTPIGEIIQTTGGYLLKIKPSDLPIQAFEIRATGKDGTLGSTQVDPNQAQTIVATIRLSEPNLTRPLLYTLRLTVLDPRQQPIQKAEITADVGEVKTTTSGWEISVAQAQAPQGPFSIYAKTDEGFYGKVEVTLAQEALVLIKIQLKEEPTFIQGKVQAADGTPLNNRKVWIDLFERDATQTDGDGRFRLEAHAPLTHTIRIYVARPGQPPYSQTHVVQDTANIVLPK